MDTPASRLAHAMADRGRKITPLAEAAGMTYQGVKNQTVSTNCYSRHTANGIMRQAGINHRF